MRAFHLFLVSSGALCASCVTSGDLRAVSDELAKIEAKVRDESATVDDVVGQLQASGQAIESLADQVEDRTEGFIEGVSQTGESGILAALAAVGLHLYRNHTRKKVLPEIVKANGA